MNGIMISLITAQGGGG